MVVDNDEGNVVADETFVVSLPTPGSPTLRILTLSNLAKYVILLKVLL